MGKASSEARREERRQRSEHDRQVREYEKRARTVRSRLFLVAGILVAAAVVYLGVTRRKSSDQVWSPEHGHWHDALGRELRGK
jgi:hypothetical protein